MKEERKNNRKGKKKERRKGREEIERAKKGRDKKELPNLFNHR